mgnify:CR=1 FL=1
MYSEYLDEFIVWKGSARELLHNKRLVLKFVEKYVPKEKIVNIHYGLKREFSGVFILDIWVELTNGYTSFIAVDSPIPLSFKQWEIIANTLNKMYMRNRICVLNVNDIHEKQVIIDKLLALSKIYDEMVKFVSSMSNLEKVKSICYSFCKPWNVILALKRGITYEVYLAPRIVVDEAICSSRGYWIR